MISTLLLAYAINKYQLPQSPNEDHSMEESLLVSCANERTSLVNGMTKTATTLDSPSIRYAIAKKVLQVCGMMAIAYSCFLSLATSPTLSYLWWNQKITPAFVSSSSPCGKVLSAVFADMHDGDQKVVSIHNDVLAIHSASEDESWIVTAHLDLATCTAMVDFNVPGKPSPPPVPLLVTVWDMERLSKHHHHGGNVGGSSKLTLEFTDPSETIAPSKDTPLNHWVQLV